MINSEILKNERKHQKIEELEDDLKKKENETNNAGGENNDIGITKAALERAKDVIIEYKSEINWLTKDRTAEVNQVKVEKLKLEEDLRNTTMEKVGRHSKNHTKHF